jgi:hypothetical protein
VSILYLFFDGLAIATKSGYGENHLSSRSATLSPAATRHRKPIRLAVAMSAHSMEFRHGD